MASSKRKTDLALCLSCASVMRHHTHECTGQPHHSTILGNLCQDRETRSKAYWGLGCDAEYKYRSSCCRDWFPHIVAEPICHLTARRDHMARRSPVSVPRRPPSPLGQHKDIGDKRDCQAHPARSVDWRQL